MLKEELLTWLDDKSKSVVAEIELNTFCGGAGLKEYAEYVGVDNSKEVIFLILKGVAEHVEHQLNSGD